MSTSAAHAAEFYREVAVTGVVWGIKDLAGFPAPITAGGKRSMPFWSSESRAKLIISSVAAYGSFVPVPIAWAAFCERWVPGLTNDGLLAGVNWSGAAANGYDVDPNELLRNVEAARYAS